MKKNKIDLKQYKKGNSLGKGSFGQVSLYINDQTGQQVAVKQFESNNTEIEIERDIMNCLDHPFIVKILGYSQNEKSTYLILQYCNNGNLSEYILAHKKRQQQWLQIFKCIVDAFYYIQSTGIMHRDLKTDNILMDNDIPKIADFGCAKQAQNCKSVDVGTFVFSSPQVLNYQSYTQKADVFSAGVILYMMLFKKHPYNQTNIKHLVQSMKNFCKKVTIPQKQEISVMTMKLLTGMFQYEEQDRLSWNQLYIHESLRDKIMNPYKYFQYCQGLSKLVNYLHYQIKQKFQYFAQYLLQYNCKYNPVKLYYWSARLQLSILYQIQRAILKYNNHIFACSGQQVWNQLNRFIQKNKYKDYYTKCNLYYQSIEQAVSEMKAKNKIQVDKYSKLNKNLIKQYCWARDTNKMQKQIIFIIKNYDVENILKREQPYELSFLYFLGILFKLEEFYHPFKYYSFNYQSEVKFLKQREVKKMKQFIETHLVKRKLVS